MKNENSLKKKISNKNKLWRITESRSHAESLPTKVQQAYNFILNITRKKAQVIMFGSYKPAALYVTNSWLYLLKIKSSCNNRLHPDNFTLWTLDFVKLRSEISCRMPFNTLYILFTLQLKLWYWSQLSSINIIDQWVEVWIKFLMIL